MNGEYCNNYLCIAYTCTYIYLSIINFKCFLNSFLQSMLKNFFNVWIAILKHYIILSNVIFILVCFTRNWVKPNFQYIWQYVTFQTRLRKAVKFIVVSSGLQTTKLSRLSPFQRSQNESSNWVWSNQSIFGLNGFHVGQKWNFYSAPSFPKNPENRSCNFRREDSRNPTRCFET